MIIYVIDTSSLIHMQKEYNIRSFLGLWQDMRQLVKQKRLFAPSQVFDEIKRKDDDISEWCKTNREMFIRENSNYIQLKGLKLQINIIERAQILVQKYPQLVRPEREREDADPYVIALALELMSGQQTLNKREVFVVANEGEKEFHIHDVCKREGVKSIRFVDIVYLENWKYIRG